MFESSGFFLFFGYISFDFLLPIILAFFDDDCKHRNRQCLISVRSHRFRDRFAVIPFSIELGGAMHVEIVEKIAAIT